MSEKLPLGERPPVKMVGPAPADVKKFYVEVEGGRFGQDQFNQLSEDELIELAEKQRPKKSYEIKFIEKTNEITNNILEDLGLPAFDVPERNIQIIDRDLFDKLSPGPRHAASCDLISQRILISNDTTENPFITAVHIFHEMTHIKGYVADEVYPSRDNPDEYYKDAYRRGLMSFSTVKKAREGAGFFDMGRGINEAVVAEITRRYTGDVIESAALDPQIAKLLEFQRSEEVQKFIATEIEKEFSPDELIFIPKNYKDEENVRFDKHTYADQRKVLNYIVQCISEDNETTPEESMRLFMKAHFTGNLVDLARSIDKTFAKNAFRTLMHMTGDPSSAKRVLDELMKIRRLKKTKNNVK